MNNLKKEINSNINVQSEILDKIVNRFELKNYVKKDMIPCFGIISTHLLFIEEGLVRVYFIDEEGKEITLQIGIEKMWINNLFSFFQQSISNIYIEVLEPTTIYQIEKSTLENLYLELPSMESFIRIKLQKFYTSLQDRTVFRAPKNAEERYLDFQHNYGSIEGKVPQYIIASYLNISPEYLSKIRNKLSVKISS